MADNNLTPGVSAVILHDAVDFFPESLRRRLDDVELWRYPRDITVGGLVGSLRGRGHPELAETVLWAAQWWLNTTSKEAE